jgi:hypothetical protein
MVLHMNEGKTNNYYWIEGHEFSLHELVTKCPELLTGKTVAITSFDSGPLSPNDEEKGFGWYSKDNVFYAPKITNPRDLPYEQYDEWYIFDNLKEFEPIDTFVNYGSFFLGDPIYKLQEADPTWDKVGIQRQIDSQREMQEKFWDYIRRIEPRSFVMDGDRFIFGSRIVEDINLIKSKIAEQRHPADRQ